jgi:phenylpropionate dioxygenase-like ring-hydroxylating dioxygenase large terminal subunit
VAEARTQTTVSTNDLAGGNAVVEEVAARLADGLTPTAAWYIDPSVHELERKAVFGRTWQLVGAVTDLQQTGDYFVAAVDAVRSYIVVRDEDDRIRGFSNVCSHRGSELLEGSGCTDRIRCGYHAWTYDLQGSLVAVPGLRDMRDIDLDRYGLIEANVDTWGPFVFLNPDRTSDSLLDHLGELPAVMDTYGIDLLGVARQGNSLRYSGYLECNWKTAVENALECYHCPTAHPGFRATVDLPNWHIALKGGCVVQGTTLRPDTVARNGDGQMSSLVAEAALGADGSDLAMFHWLFPNNSVSLWPGPSNSFNFARWVPLGPNRCRWETIRWWSSDVPDAVRDAQWNFISDVGEEDRLIVEKVHRGMLSGSWAGGPFMLGRDLAEDTVATMRDERGPHRFNTLTAQAITSFGS